MRKLDFYWKSNPDWYHLTENLDYVINDTAPIEAQESYANYLKQLNEK